MDRSGAGGNNKGAEEESMVYLDGWPAAREKRMEWGIDRLIKSN